MGTRLERQITSPIYWRKAFGAAILAIALALVTGSIVLRRFPSSADEFGYLFEANTFLAGRLWNAVPAGGQALSPLFVWVHDGKWVAQYPPGWPGIIALGKLIGLNVWVLGAGLLALAMFALFSLVRRQAGVKAATFAAAIFGLSPFTIFNAGSLFSHMLAATLVVGSYAIADNRDTKRREQYAAMVGLLIGLLGITRSLTAAVALGPILFTIVRQHDWRRLIFIFIGGLPFVAILLYYQWQITGHILRPTYYVAGRDVDHLYFQPYQIRAGLTQTWFRVLDLGIWTSPGLVLLGFVAILTKFKMRDLTSTDFVFPIGAAIFVFYPFPAGNKFGPRYYFDFFPMLICTICTVKYDYSPRLATWREQIMAMTIVSGLELWISLAVGFNRISFERDDLYRLVENKRLKNAVVCVARGTGETLPMPYHDLVRNDVNAKDPVLFANCAMINPKSLSVLFPSREIWKFQGGTLLHGTLSRVR